MNELMDGETGNYTGRQTNKLTDLNFLQVRLIDVGEVVIADANQLFTLSTSFLATPPLVIEVFLCGLLPPDADLDWTPPVS